MCNQDKSSKSSDPTMNPSNPYFLHPIDTRLKLMPTVFSGVGFKAWKRAISIGLLGKKKLEFIDCMIKRSTTSSAHRSFFLLVIDSRASDHICCELSFF